MGAERPLDAARQRIAERKKVISQPLIEAPEIETSKTESEVEELAKMDFLSKVPRPLMELVRDAVKTIEERDKCSLATTQDFAFSTHNPKEIGKLLFSANKSPIGSVCFSFETTIIEKGSVHKRIVFGPVSPIEEKDRDITYKVFLGITYNGRDKLVEWIMGDRNGPEFKLESERGYHLSTHDGHVKGSIRYSEENMLTLAEDLVAQIDLGRYKYQVREIPTTQLQQG